MNFDSESISVFVVAFKLKLITPCTLPDVPDAPFTVRSGWSFSFDVPSRRKALVDAEGPSDRRANNFTGKKKLTISHGHTRASN